MDSFTHIVLGGCIGEALVGKKIGRRALIWGAVAQSLPDIDVISSLWTTTSESLLAHRGFTHSILFCLLATFLLGLLAQRLHRPFNVTMRLWLLFLGTELFTHIFLDGFNIYGTGWLEPFSHHRFSLNAIFVADPLFTIFPAVGFVVLWIKKIRNPQRKFWWRLGIIGSIAYLSVCLINKIIVETHVRKSFVVQHIPHGQYFTAPTPFNNMLWYIVAHSDSGYYIGFRSVFDNSSTTVFTYFPQNKYLLQPIAGHEDLQQLIRFSKGYYTVNKKNNALVFNDLRFGQIAGWQNPNAGFVFYYYLNQPDENDLIVQRGRFKGWNKEIWISLFKKIIGT